MGPFPTTQPRERASDADLKWAIEKLGEIGRSLEEIYANAKRRGLTNSAIMGTVLDSIRMQTDEILDLAETLELAMNQRVDVRFAEVEQEHAARNRPVIIDPMSCGL